MKEITLDYKQVNPQDYRGRYATEADCTIEISEPCTIRINGHDGVVVYTELNERYPEVVTELSRISFGKNYRTNAMITQSRTFGYQPRQVQRAREGCSRSAIAQDYPNAAAAIEKLATRITEEYKTYAPEAYEQHLGKASEVLADWKIDDTPFTSGIINCDSQLPYHYDKGNIKGCWSNMITFKNGIRGGDLVLPELDAVIRLRDHSVLMFEGQSLLHGVTPFKKLGRTSHRFTVVYYSLDQMWRCLPPGEELKRSNVLRSQRELKRVTG